MRFSKIKLARYIETQVRFAREAFEREMGAPFDEGIGYEQVSGKGDHANRIYGRIDALERLWEHFELTGDMLEGD